VGSLTVFPAKHHNLVQAAEGEVAVLQAPGMLDVAVSVGGTGPSALRQAFYCLLEQISLPPGGAHGPGVGVRPPLLGLGGAPAWPEAFQVLPQEEMLMPIASMCKG